jgi:hypothetical protein
VLELLLASCRMPVTTVSKVAAVCRDFRRGLEDASCCSFDSWGEMCIEGNRLLSAQGEARDECRQKQEEWSSLCGKRGNIEKELMELERIHQSGNWHTGLDERVQTLQDEYRDTGPELVVLGKSKQKSFDVLAEIEKELEELRASSV